MQIELKTDFNPIPDQIEVFTSQSKLNSVPSTRRSGKTSGIVYYANLWAIEGKEVGIVMPDYTYCGEIYSILHSVLKPLLKYSNSQRQFIKTITGGRIRFYSYEAFEKIRGKKFHKLLLDEFQFFAKPINHLMAVILPTLADLNGQAWFLGTPKKGTPIEDISLSKSEIWSHFKMKAVNNPFITPEEIALQRSLLDPLVFAQEWEGEFVDFNSERWLYEFDFRKHLVEDLPFDNNEPLYLTFDFNIDPGTCLAFQVINDRLEDGGGLNFLKEFSISGGTPKVCNHVKHWIESIPDFNGVIWVTGDSSGSKGDTRGTLTDYQIISNELEIPLARFIDTRKQNPNLGYSRDLCNTAFHNNIIFVDSKNCPILAKELTSAKPKDRTDNLLKDRENNKLDSFDAMRYGIHAVFKSIKDVLKFKQLNN